MHGTWHLLKLSFVHLELLNEASNEWVHKFIWMYRARCVWWSNFWTSAVCAGNTAYINIVVSVLLCLFWYSRHFCVCCTCVAVHHCKNKFVFWPQSGHCGCSQAEITTTANALTTLRTSVRKSLQMNFKVAVRNFHAFIQAGNSLTDVSGHYQHAE